VQLRKVATAFASGAVLLVLTAVQTNAVPFALGLRHQGIPSGFEPRFATRLGSSAAIVVGTTPCDRATCVELLLTSDAGRSFSVLSSPPVSPVYGSATGSLVSLLFANRKDGYALEGSSNYALTTLYATVDGGRSWQREVITPGFSVYGSAATPTRFYFVMARCTGEGDARSCAYELATLLAGESRWAILPVPDAVQLGGAEIGVAAYGSDVWLDEPVDPRNIAISHDDGRTFAVTGVGAMPGIAPCSLTAVSALELWAECRGLSLEGLFHSSDGGEHFVSIRTPILIGALCISPLAVPTGSIAYFALDCGGRNADDIIALTGGGARWRVWARLPVFSASIVFTNERDGIAVGYEPSGTRTVLLRTVDQGRHWDTVLR
jgi:hypothetical protein